MSEEQEQAENIKSIEIPVFWRKCSRCKKEISFSAKYLRCSVSTCNKKRAPMTFCSDGCWDSHVPIMNHRSAWYETHNAPSVAEYQKELEAPAPKRRSMSSNFASADRIAEQPTEIINSGEAVREILIVASKLKAYVEERASMNTSQRVMMLLSDRLREVCDIAILSASKHGRKTLLDRDFPQEMLSREVENEEILVIASRMKNYIKEKSSFNTSKSVFVVLSQEIREAAKSAIRQAAMAERTTLLERDLEF